MIKKSPSQQELIDAYRKYHIRKDETRFDNWGEKLPDGIIKESASFCTKCGDATDFWSVQAAVPIPMCSSTCNDEWWYDYFKEEEKNNHI